MKKIIKHTASCLCITVLAFMLQSCATKQKALNQLRDFTEEIEANSMSYDLNDWKKAAEKYAKANKKVAKFRGKYSADEASEIGELNGKCVGIFATSVVSNVAGKVTNGLKGIEGLLDGIKQALEK